MTQVCLTDLLNAVNSQFSAVLDVRIDVETISQFLGSQRLEEHYHPSSLAFRKTKRQYSVMIFINGIFRIVCVKRT